MEIGTKRNFAIRKFAVILAYLILLCIVAAGSARKFMSNVPDVATQLKEVDDDTSWVVEIFKKCFICGCSHAEPAETIIKRDPIKRDPIKGDPVNPLNKYPWLVLIAVGNYSLCSGAILDGSYILTSAHCLSRSTNCTGSQKSCKFKNDEVMIILLTPKSDHYLRIGPPVKEIFIHPEYKLQTPHQNDIAVVKMRSPITCDAFVSPICLPPSNFSVPAKSMLSIAGWGFSCCHFEEPIDLPLMETEVFAVDVSKCGFGQQNETGVHCVTGTEGKTPCFGDYGGRPMFFKEKVYYTLGIASVPNSAICDPSATKIYTDVPKFMKYIQNITGLQSAHEVIQRKNGGKRSIKRRT